MRRSSAWLVSAAVHGALAVAVIALGRGPRPAPRLAPTRVTLASVGPAPVALPPAPVVVPPRGAEGGGGRPVARAARSRARPQPARPVASPSPVAPAAPPLPAAVASPPAAIATAAAAGPAEPMAAPAASPGAGGTGGGAGGGRGGGVGAGDGAGDGAGRGWSAALASASRLARTPRRSLARPARLIWPVRTGDASQGTLLTARLRVDDDGFVVGVRLPAAPLRRREQDAAAAVWRFRYDPARDDAGRPIASTVEQAFVLRR
ncbi:MAG: hypothetical protein IPH44_25485 [Myxococcales bacterium]|nr:hypothetical protein [Myxococcales bacterium]MBP6842704.1 hypothetical protein [Kofleriaceae bacterium]